MTTATQLPPEPRVAEKPAPAPPRRVSRPVVPCKDPFGTNPLLKPKDPRSGHSRQTLMTSVALHALLTAVVLLLPAVIGGRVVEENPIDIVFFAPAERERVPPPELPEPPLEPLAVTPPAPRPEPQRVPPPVETPPPVARSAPPVRRSVEPAPRPVVTPPEPPAPKVRTNVLEEVRTATLVAPPKRSAQTGSFGSLESAPPTAPPRERAAVVAGGFAAPPSDAPVGVKDTRVVASGSFSDGPVNVPREGEPRRRGAVTGTGFGSVAEGADPSSRSTPGTVSQGGFGEGAVAAAPAPRRREQPGESPDTPVEVVSKPRPVYTEEARGLRVEGEVVLEVTFLATGRIRVIRIVEGLGHGLDEAAIEAAEKIKFTPARRNGQPVDHTATLRVVFRLA